MIMDHLTQPRTLGTSRVTINTTATNGGVTDITVPSGAKRVVITVPAALANTIRVRGGISGTASITSDITTLVAPNANYMDTIIFGDDTKPSSVDLRFTSAITWLRVYFAESTGAPIVHFTFFESSAILPNEVEG